MVVIQIHYDPILVSQSSILNSLIAVEYSLPNTMDNMVFHGRKLIFPLVPDDRWSREALERYTQSIRDEAVYLPSNIEYLARNNGLEGGAMEALQILLASEWVSTSFFPLIVSLRYPNSLCLVWDFIWHAHS